MEDLNMEDMIEDCLKKIIVWDRKKEKEKKKH